MAEGLFLAKAAGKTCSSLPQIPGSVTEPCAPAARGVLGKAMFGYCRVSNSL